MIRSVKINEVEYSVQETAQADMIEGAIACLGDVEYDICSIRIRKDLPESQKQATLMHEILHAVCNECGLDEIKSREEIIEPLSREILRFLRTNPEAVRYLQGKIDTPEIISKMLAAPVHPDSFAGQQMAKTLDPYPERIPIYKAGQQVKRKGGVIGKIIRARQAIVRGNDNKPFRDVLYDVDFADGAETYSEWEIVAGIDIARA